MNRRRSDNGTTAELVVRAQAGEPDAFAALYARHFDPVYGYLRMLLRDPHEAEDAVQQVFVKAFEGLAGYEERKGKGFSAWLFRIARNEALMHLRKHGRVAIEDPGTMDRFREADGAPPELVAHGWPSDHDLARWLGRLPEAQRQAITLRYMFEMRTDEIAEVLDRTPEAIRKLLQRGLATLQERMGPTRPQRRQRSTPMLVRMRRAPVVRARRYALSGTVHPFRRR